MLKGTKKRYRVINPISTDALPFDITGKEIIWEVMGGSLETLEVNLVRVQWTEAGEGWVKATIDGVTRVFDVSIEDPKPVLGDFEIEELEDE